MTHTFKDSKNEYQFSVNPEFLKICPHPEKLTCQDLLIKEKIIQYLHNPAGPAVVRLADNYGRYFIDGVILDDDATAKLQHDTNFKNKVLEVLNEET